MIWRNRRGYDPWDDNGGGAFSPAQIPGLHRWWDPAYGVTLTAGDISQWDDRVINDPAIQAVAASRPLGPAASALLANKLAVDYDGNDELIGTCTLASQGSIFVAGYCRTTPSGYAACTSVVGGVNTGISLFFEPPDFVCRRLGGGALDTRFFVAALPVAFVGGISATTTGHEAFFNALTPTTNAIAAAAFNLNFSYVGSLAGLVYPCDGLGTETIIYDRALATAESQRVMRYLGAKYGVTLGP